MLWTKILLLLFVSAATGATLGHYQTEETQEAPAGADGSEDAGVGDSPEAEEPADNSLFGRKLLSKILGNPAADGPELDLEAAPETDSDGPAVVEPALEAVAKEQPSPPEEEEGNDIRPVQTNQDLERTSTHEDDSWSLNSVRSSFQTVHGYFNSLVELVGGQDGVCQYQCRYGESPQPRPGYQVSEPDGCSSSLVGFQVNGALDLGIPAMTRCCDQLDLCYETCGTNKYHCDKRFRSCLHDICSDLNKSLGFVTKVQACESVADTLYNTVWTFGCRSYMNSQRAACICEEEERDEL